MPGQQLLAEHGQLRRELLELLDEHRQDPTRQLGQARLGLVPDRRDQLCDMARALGRDDAELGQMPAQGVDQHGALTHEQITGAVDGQRRLLRFALDRDEPHRRPGHRLADRRGVGRIVLVPLAVGLDVLGRHQPDLVPEGRELTRPVVRRGARLHADQTGRQPGEERCHLAAPQRLAQHHLARTVHCVHLEHLLGQIKSDRG